jgi:hypothetical protein
VIDHLVVIPRTQGISSSELRQHNVDTYEEFRKIETLVKDLVTKVEGKEKVEGGKGKGKGKK